MTQQFQFAIVLFFVVSLCSCTAPKASFEPAAGLKVLKPAAPTGASPRLQVLDVEGRPLVGREVEVWAHRDSGTSAGLFGQPKRKSFGLVKIGGAETDEQGRIALDLEGRSFGVDDGDADDLRIAIYEKGWLAHVEFIQDLVADLSVVMPKDARVPKEIRSLRFTTPDGAPVAGLTLRAIEPNWQSKTHSPYWRCRFGPSNAEGLLYLPRLERHRLLFEVQLAAGQQLKLVLGAKEELAPAGVVKEICVPNLIEVELDASKLTFATKARLRGLERSANTDGYWSVEESHDLPAGNRLRILFPDTSEKRLLLELQSSSTQLVRLHSVAEEGVGRNRKLHCQFIPEACEPGRGRIEDWAPLGRVELEEGRRDAEALATFRDRSDTWDYAFRVVNKVAFDGTFQLPRFPADRSSVSVAEPGLKGDLSQATTGPGWDWQFPASALSGGGFLGARDGDLVFAAPEPAPPRPNYRGRVVDSLGQPCPYARLDVYRNQSEFDGLFRSTYWRRSFYTFCDADGRFAFHTGLDHDEIEAHFGALDGATDFIKDQAEYLIVVD